MRQIDSKKEWDFIIKETHNGNRENRIKREILFVLQCELSKQEPNMDFYREIKEKYLELDN